MNVKEYVHVEPNYNQKQHQLFSHNMKITSPVTVYQFNCPLGYFISDKSVNTYIGFTTTMVTKKGLDFI